MAEGIELARLKKRSENWRVASFLFQSKPSDVMTPWAVSSPTAWKSWRLPKGAVKLMPRLASIRPNSRACLSAFEVSVEVLTKAMMLAPELEAVSSADEKSWLLRGERTVPATLPPAAT